MKSPVHFIPDGYHTATPYLIAKNASQAIDFYKQAFGASELLRVCAPGGKVGHAEIQIGDSRIMLADECPDWGALSPQTIGGTPVGLALYVENCDAMFAKAVELGAQILKPVEDQFYGDRSGTLLDPFGHKWTIATHIEDIAPAELERRAAAMFAGSGAPGVS
jgi:PhnB protein